MSYKIILIHALQGLLFGGIAPLALGYLRWIKARFQGRQGPHPIQPYLDLVKLFRKQAIVPDSASWIFSSTPYFVFGCYLLLGMIIPILYLPDQNPIPELSFNWPLADLLVIVYLLGFARFMQALAGMDTGSPLAGLGSGREMFMHFLAEPSMILLVYALALNTKTTSLPAIMRSIISPQEEYQILPALLLIIAALFFLTLAETGRIPFDNPDTHLELTMVGKAIELEYTGAHLALLEWANAMRLVFFLTLLTNLGLPHLLISSHYSILLNIVLVLLYPAKIFGLVYFLAFWESMQAKLRLRDVIKPAAFAVIFSALAVLAMVLIQ